MAIVFKIRSIKRRNIYLEIKCHGQSNKRVFWPEFAFSKLVLYYCGSHTSLRVRWGIKRDRKIWKNAKIWQADWYFRVKSYFKHFYDKMTLAAKSLRSIFDFLKVNFFLSNIFLVTCLLIALLTPVTLPSAFLLYWWLR